MFADVWFVKFDSENGIEVWKKDIELWSKGIGVW